MSNDIDLNEGVQIILARMKTNPEEFFDNGGRWGWIFKDTLREVMTEIEKAALFEGLKNVRRMEITAKAASTVLRADERDEKESYLYAGNTLTTTAGSNGTNKMMLNPAQVSLVKKLAEESEQKRTFK